MGCESRVDVDVLLCVKFCLVFDVEVCRRRKPFYVDVHEAALARMSKLPGFFTSLYDIKSLSPRLLLLAILSVLFFKIEEQRLKSLQLYFYINHVIFIHCLYVSLSMPAHLEPDLQPKLQASPLHFKEVTIARTMVSHINPYRRSWKWDWKTKADNYSKISA